jgi:hypothetical protein
MNDLRNGALRLLAENPDGCTAARMVAHGFTLEVLIELIVAGLATTQTEQVGRASQPMGRTHFRITEAGRRVFNDPCLRRGPARRPERRVADSLRQRGGQGGVPERETTMRSWSFSRMALALGSVCHSCLAKALSPLPP